MKLLKKIMLHFEEPSEFVFLVVLFIVSLCFLFESFSFNPAARAFPLFASSVTAICIVIHVVKRLRMPLPEGAEESAEKSGEEKRDARESAIKIIITLLIFALYTLLAYLFGFLISSIVIAIAYPLIFKYKRPLSVIGLLALNVGTVVLFQKLLGIPLTRGIFLDLTHWFY